MNKYLVLKPVKEGSYPIVNHKVLGYEKLKDARHCVEVNSNGAVIVKFLNPNEARHWDNLTQKEEK